MIMKTFCKAKDDVIINNFILKKNRVVRVLETQPLEQDGVMSCVITFPIVRGVEGRVIIRKSFLIEHFNYIS